MANMMNIEEEIRKLSKKLEERKLKNKKEVLKKKAKIKKALDNIAKDRNAKDKNAKDRNAKDRNAKDRNAKDRNAKDRNAKDRNIKDRNAKDRNAKDKKLSKDSRNKKKGCKNLNEKINKIVTKSKRRQGREKVGKKLKICNGCDNLLCGNEPTTLESMINFKWPTVPVKHYKCSVNGKTAWAKSKSKVNDKKIRGGCNKSRFRSNEDDRFRSNEDGRFRNNEEGRFRNNEDGRFRSNEDDRFRSNEDDRFRSNKDDCFRSNKDDRFRSNKDDRFRSNKDDRFGSNEEKCCNKENCFRSNEENCFRSNEENCFRSNEENCFRSNEENCFRRDEDNHIYKEKCGCQQSVYNVYEEKGGLQRISKYNEDLVNRRCKAEESRCKADACCGCSHEEGVQPGSNDSQVMFSDDGQGYDFQIHECQCIKDPRYTEESPGPTDPEQDVVGFSYQGYVKQSGSDVLNPVVSVCSEGDESQEQGLSSEFLEEDEEETTSGPESEDSLEFYLLQSRKRRGILKKLARIFCGGL